ncbi:MAG TPA: PBP1A family penicillin-binding protein [Pyrinomonadaceae bacterium]|nr:PBP1A family penicillin-binding protein [Pyrinomonadaceae bacterium]
MAIEVTSISDRRSVRELISRPFHFFAIGVSTGRRKLLLLATVLILLTAGAALSAVFQSYRFHADLIDARLKSGYLTSRPGIYAAPRTISFGQLVRPEDLVKVLRRAGYTDTQASVVWSGSFKRNEGIIEIYPARPATGPSVIRVVIGSDGKIGELTGDHASLPSYTLEPEILTTDPLSRNGQHTPLTYQQIPPVLVHAILSIEDKRFFGHQGLDFYGVGRALLRNVGDDRTGQGGSTITQQLVKNTYLTPERTYRRKFAEAMLAIALERRLSKEDIFALYCNEIFMGQRGAVAIRGVEQAARVYFGKEVKDLTVTEAATIAGMIQGPTRYSPDRHADASKARRNTVLAAMAVDGWLSQEQVTAESQQPLTMAPINTESAGLAPYFVDYVNREVETRRDEATDSQQNTRVFTTIDLDLQELAEAALRKQLDRLDKVYEKRAVKPQAALVALDPHTGAVLAMVGGRSYAGSQLNRATDARRQPGSTYKPFVYAAALESGISPVQMFSDTPREFVYDRNKTYRPSNYGGGFSMRDVTMRTALVKSLNVITVDLAMQTGLARVANLTEQFGLPKPERYPALALGTTEVTPLQLANAYATFVRDGRRLEAQPIAGIGTPATHLVESNDAQVIKPTTAYMITNMLSAVVDHGTAKAARGAVKGSAIAGKTGTSRDGWFVGYTPNLVCVVWIGFDDNQQLGLTGAEAALPAWTDFMNGAVQARPELGGRNFTCPEGIKFVEIDSEDGLISTLSCPARELIAVTEALAPNAECFKHGNLPSTDVVEAEVSITTQLPPKPKPRTHGQDARATGAVTTRVDIDARGRKTLVNDLQ